MSLKRSAFAKKIVPVIVRWFDEEVEVGVRPALWNQDLLNHIVTLRFPEGGETEEEAKAVELEAAQVIADTIAYWDILDEDGERLPVTAELLISLPPQFVAGIPVALGEVMSAQGKD